MLLNTPPAPETTIDSGPSGLTNDPTPTFTFSSDSPGSTFECRVDSDPFTACSGPGDSHTTSSLSDGSHTFEVQATNATPQTDPTPASRSFTVDGTAPAAPDLTATDPASPANDPSPKVKGTAEAGSTVRIYSTSDCSGPALAIDSASQLDDPGITVAVEGDSTTTLHATATDAAGNVSACSAGITYRGAVGAAAGERIVFQSHRDGDSEIYSMNPDGSEQTNLTQNPLFNDM